ncbi:syntaxin [Lenzites betulinus]|nr:syntaxin [Lenzites betulinus]
MSTAIQAIHIPAWEERTSPKPHVVFRIEIQASVRSWQMWRRYSEFADLHLELTKSCSDPPPAPLPPKHALALFRSATNPALLEERRAGLETYLRAILAARDARWRESLAFRDFLGVPVGKGPAFSSSTFSSSASALSGSGGMSSAAWLDEHQTLQARVRDVRADINRRDALADAGDVSGAHAANVHAKKTLAGVLGRVGALDAALRAHAQAGLPEGELRRRADMVARLRDDGERLAQVVTVARMTARGLGSAAERNPAAATDREALMGLGGTAGGSGFSRPVARVFGQAAVPQETEATRPLDDHGLFQLQQTQMEQQDEQLSQLSTILQRQRQIGLAIHQEVAEQNSELDYLSTEVDRVGGKLTSAKRQLNKLGG